MTSDLQETFESGTLGLWTVNNGTPTVGTSYKRYGTYGLRMQLTDGIQWYWTLPQAKLGRYIFDYRSEVAEDTSTASITMISTSYNDGGFNSIRLIAGSTPYGIYVQSPSGAIYPTTFSPTLHQWYNLRFDVYAEGSNPRVEFYVDGLLNTTVPLTPLTGAYLKWWTFFNEGTGSPEYWLDNTYRLVSPLSWSAGFEPGNFDEWDEHLYGAHIGTDAKRSGTYGCHITGTEGGYLYGPNLGDLSNVNEITQEYYAYFNTVPIGGSHGLGEVYSSDDTDWHSTTYVKCGVADSLYKIYILTGPVPGTVYTGTGTWTPSTGVWYKLKIHYWFDDDYIYGDFYVDDVIKSTVSVAQTKPDISYYYWLTFGGYVSLGIPIDTYMDDCSYVAYAPSGPLTKAATMDVVVGAEPMGGPIRIKKGIPIYELATQGLTLLNPRVRYQAKGTTYEVPLVAVSDPYASPAHVKTSTGIWALKWANMWGMLKQGTLDLVAYLATLPPGGSRWWLSSVTAGAIKIVTDYWWSTVVPLTAGLLVSPTWWWSAVIAVSPTIVTSYWWSLTTSVLSTATVQYWWSSISSGSTKVETGYWWSSIAAI